MTNLFEKKPINIFLSTLRINKPLLVLYPIYSMLLFWLLIQELLFLEDTNIKNSIFLIRENNIRYRSSMYRYTILQI